MLLIRKELLQKAIDLISENCGDYLHLIELLLELTEFIEQPVPPELVK